MARRLKENEYLTRRNEILAATRRLVYTKGYEQMTIQDILDDLQISKGAFYHYFNSKGDVLEALVEHMVTDEVLPIVQPIVADSSLSAIEKLERYFAAGLNWKTTQKPLMLAILRVWLADENAIVRQKMFSATVKQVTPLLAGIIRQGVNEGVFTSRYPEQTCHVLIYILQGLSDTILQLFVASEADLSSAQVESTVTSYADALSDAMERVLGAPAGSLKLIDPETLKEWFVSSEETIPSPDLATA
jgi:AcrR family transcriptional regulator